MNDAPALTPFHLAFPVTDLAATRGFYAELLGCGIGREDERWIDFDFFGHQITAHLVDAALASPAGNLVDGKDVPIPHFGAVLEWAAWHQLAARLRQAGLSFLIEPHIRFPGQVGEQATMFLRDPSGNHLEFKSFREPERLFQR
ncbi:VOC family protein [Haliangium ochraceum]|uniref:Glyoxalase/bleomycin resistance protein/dioxygenase n=1 Tax=Haliangium ochraceum (strain DSM 14365 / JCM 11303 / SMP-2) TaxID=502025 RepID=D0LM23_HALO1|nr:VOC family protein [Haliangium ochraceum]ACY15201.1 Glyoxalase/bleomycin resistance protein/dioxygenase [Haliangium ochraceum DSM 14365]